jgi:hypothetical protein
MRAFIAAGLMSAAIVSLGACSKPAPGGNAAAAPGSPGASASAGPTGALTPDQFPHRKPGLWTQIMGLDQAPTGPGMKLCVDDASEAKMSAFAQKMPGEAKCDIHVTRNLDGSMNVASTCAMGAAGKVTTTGVIKGDFNSSFTETMNTVYSGSPVAALNGPHTLTIVDTWTGPCPPGARGGDLTLGNGTTHNVLDDDAARAGASNAAGN